VTSEELFKSITAKLLSDEAISRKKMFGSTGLSIGGKVFALLVKGKLVVKLPYERVETIISSGRGEPFDPGHGRLMKLRMVREAANKDKQELYQLRTELIKGIDPLEANGTELHEAFMKINHRVNEA
jgi:TfoX/Sxy family transcriptional regulator of competence genes